MNNDILLYLYLPLFVFPAQVGHRYEIHPRPTRDYSGLHVFKNSNDDNARDISNDANETVYLNQNDSLHVRVTRYKESRARSYYNLI